jgi:hypothetical protein
MFIINAPSYYQGSKAWIETSRARGGDGGHDIFYFLIKLQFTLLELIFIKHYAYTPLYSFPIHQLSVSSPVLLYDSIRKNKTGKYKYIID